MNLSCTSKISNNTQNIRNYTSLDIKEKIKILHKINSYNFQKSFDLKNLEIKNDNEKLLSSTLPSFVLKRNNVYQKKLIKNYSSKNSPNIFIIKQAKKEKKQKNMNKEEILNEIKSDVLLKQSIKKELKDEIINEFLEDLVNIDDKKVIDFLKIKNLILSSEKFKSNIDQKILSKDISNPDIINTNTNTNTNTHSSLNHIYFSEKKNMVNNKNNKFILNLEEIQMKNNTDNKRSVNSTPIKTIYNNLFINNNEKYIIKKPYQEYCRKNYHNSKKIFNYDIKLSKFNFQIINERKNNNIINNESFSDLVSRSNFSYLEEDILTEKVNLDTEKNMDNSMENEKDICNYKDDENDTIIHCFNSINKKEKKPYDIKYIRKSLEKDNLINNKCKDKKEKKNKEELKIDICAKNEMKIFDKKRKKKENNNSNIIKNKIRKNDVKIEDEKRKLLIKKIIEDSKKAIKNKNFFNNKYINLFVLRKNNRKKLYIKDELLNKSVMYRKNKNIKLNPIEKNLFNSFSAHKGRNKTFSNFLNEEKSNIFRISHIKKYLKVLQKENNRHLLNTKWLKNISKKNMPLLCFDKK